jgi:hypothetical protein
MIISPPGHESKRSSDHQATRTSVIDHRLQDLGQDGRLADGNSAELDILPAETSSRMGSS